MRHCGHTSLCIVHYALCIAFAALSAANAVTYVEYIESDGSSQYIDLGIEGRCNLEVEAELAYVALPGDGGFIGSRTGDTRFYPLHYYNGKMQFGYKGLYASPIDGMVGVKYQIDAKFVPGSQTLTVNGVPSVSRSDANDWTSGRNLFLFATNNGGSPQYYTNGRIYSLRIWNLDANGERDGLLGDFRPCLDANDVPCLYDSVTDGYFYNAGSGAFAYRALPAANAATVDHYVEYVESDGTQFVDTGVFAQGGLHSSVKFSFTTVPNDGGILSAAVTGSRFYLAYYYPGNNGFCSAYGSANPPASQQLATAGTVYTIETDLFADRRDLYINDAEVGTLYTTTRYKSSSTTFHLFGRNNAGSSDYRSSMRLYACSIWASPFDRKQHDLGDLVLVLDLHPCVDTDGVAGLYDLVSGRILYKDRGNDFVAGPTLASDARVIASDAGEFAGTASPAYGTDDSVQQGDIVTYSCEKYFMADDGRLFECVGYTTATSEDGTLWSAESALVESRSATLAYPGGWWRLTWNWRQTGWRISTAFQEGASVTVSAPANDYPANSYPAGSNITFTASATAGAGSVFAGWIGDVPSGVFVSNRSVTVVADAPKSLTALYRHGWTIASENGNVKTITDGVWNVEVENGVVGLMADGAGPLDFTDVERDLGFKITSFKSWMPNTAHLGPQLITEIIAPDAETVEALTFDDCLYLERVVLSPSLHHIGRSAFYRCSSLREFSPSLSRYLSQARNTTAADMYIFRYCANLKEDIVVERSRGVGTLVLPDAVFQESGVRSVDFSRCRGNVDLTSTDSYSTFRRCGDIGYMKLQPNLESIPRGMCWGLSSLTNLYITGVMPAPENIGGFYSYDFYRLKVYISKALNPNVVADLRLRAPTEAEMAKATFPRAEYEAGKFLGVWDQPTSGWGALENDGKFRQMWVLDWNPPVTGATVIMLR